MKHQEKNCPRKKGGVQKKERGKSPTFWKEGRRPIIKRGGIAQSLMTHRNAFNETTTIDRKMKRKKLTRCEQALKNRE